MFHALILHTFSMQTVQREIILSVSPCDLVNTPNSGINDLVLPTFSDSKQQVAVQFLGELEEYFKLNSIFF